MDLWQVANPMAVWNRYQTGQSIRLGNQLGNPILTIGTDWHGRRENVINAAAFQNASKTMTDVSISRQHC